MKLLSTLTVIVLILLTACTKPATRNPIHDKIVGKWKGTFAISDSNSNRHMDVHDAYDTLNSQYIIEYFDNGNGTIWLNNASAGSFTWQLQSNNAYLATTTSGHIITRHIDSLGNSTMILLDTTGVTWFWQVFAKQ